MGRTDKVLTFFDIDGVLNPYLGIDLGEEFKPFMTSEFVWRIDRTYHSAWLRHLEKISDLRWISAWEASSNLLATEYGLSKTAYKHINFGYSGSLQTWKLSSVNLALRKVKNPLIWIDDELHEDAYDWAINRGRTLLIKTDPRWGWTKAQYESMVFFIENQKSLSQLSGKIGRQVIAHLHDIREIAAQYDLTNLRVFGSASRGEDDGMYSDLDLIANVPEKSRNLFDAFAPQRDFEDLLGVKVDFVPENVIAWKSGIDPDLKNSILLYA